jgi:hypothetical protein
MTRDFGFYEYAGIIIPGAVLGAGILWLTPEGRALITHEGLSFGAFGLFVILAYALGQLVQGIGNGIEWAWWKAWGGRPTEQVLAGKLLSTEQHARLVRSLAQNPHVPRDTSQLSTSERLAIVREVQSVVAAAGRDKRVETFLGNYGLLRGLAASFLVLTVLAIMLSQGPTTSGAFGTLFLLATQRMHRFSKYFALELFMQYLLVTGEPPSAPRGSYSS